jgi:hypothetical protein
MEELAAELENHNESNEADWYASRVSEVPRTQASGTPMERPLAA